jgi:hypothetical protein
VRIFLTWNSFLEVQEKFRNIVNAEISREFQSVSTLPFDKACVAYIGYLVALKTVFLEFRKERLDVNPGSKITNYETQYLADEDLLDFISQVIPGLKEKEDGQMLDTHFLNNNEEENRVFTVWSSKQNRQNIFLLIHVSEENKWSLYYDDNGKIISGLPLSFRKQLQGFHNPQDIKYKKTKLLRELINCLKRNYKPSTWTSFIPEKPDVNIARFVYIQEKLVEHLQLIWSERDKAINLHQYFFSYPILYYAIHYICNAYADLPAQIMKSPDVQQLYISHLEALHKALKPSRTFAEVCAQALNQQTLHVSDQPTQASIDVIPEKQPEISIVDQSSSSHSQHSPKEEIPYYTNYQQLWLLCQESTKEGFNLTQCEAVLFEYENNLPKGLIQQHLAYKPEENKMLIDFASEELRMRLREVFKLDESTEDLSPGMRCNLG